MACFVVSAAEALVVTAVEKIEKKKEEKALESGREDAVTARIPLSHKLSWLKYMLWGGVILLAFEHLWHGEIVPYLPFLTAMSDPGDTAEMLKEIATVGVCMALLITAVWAVMCFAAETIMKRSDKAAKEKA